jgi:uncharacterized protein (TIRG00374 family)
MALVFLVTLAGIWALAGRTPEWVWRSVAATLGLFAVAIVGLILAPRAKAWMTGLFAWPVYQKALRFGFDLLGHIRDLARHPTALLLVAVQSLYVWLCDVFLAYLLLRGIDAPLSLAVAAFTAMAADLAVTVPITPGAVGQFEAAFVGLLALFAVPTFQASLAVLLNRFVSFWTFILFSGLVTYLAGLGKVFSDLGQVVDSSRSVTDATASTGGR